MKQKVKKEYPDKEVRPGRPEYLEKSPTQEQNNTVVSKRFHRSSGGKSLQRGKRLLALLDHRSHPASSWGKQEEKKIDSSTVLEVKSDSELEKRIKPRNIKVLQCGVKLPVANMLKSTGEEFKKLLRQGGNS
ncbi:uncharacterized protein LOC128040990 [Gossypium raimondii]|uniref:uncharacterized protein LOC128040990 n=1 Tax=Gossypium raimondii TaxID=29730 RepID=UPI00227C9CF8|nr:uncharacterized protein LOC128040990 [Gossypium raimondii]